MRGIARRRSPVFWVVISLIHSGFIAASTRARGVRRTRSTNMPETRITGTITALVTPFRQGRIAFDDLRGLVEKQVAAGVDGLVPVGSTGESATLDHGEHIEVIRAVVEAARGRVRVIAGTGSNSTTEAVSLTKRAHEAGADAMLQVAPYYNKPTQEGLFRHFSAVADATDKPIMLYSIPGRCVIDIAVSTVERLRRAYPHVNHIKEAGGSCDRVDQLRQALGEDVTILCGDDALTLPFMSVGARGVVSVASNLVPQEISRMVKAALANDFAGALKIHRRLFPLFKGLFIEPNPVPIKAALAHAGIISSAEVRSPLCEMTPANRQILVGAIGAAVPS
jgi:4-hydroxy-tetrahydrodipicolinate synthase